ncbi:MAG: riboflavin synthase [Pseudomonadota bacterium]
MFSGIIHALGRIVDRIPSGESKDANAAVRLKIDAAQLPLDDLALGDSIACNGVCLTVIEKQAPYFSADVSAATLACTVGLEGFGWLNLEKALRLSDRLGGHLVSGHVDGVGEVCRFDAIGEHRLLEIRAPQALAKYIARKGSITVQGVSLTTNSVEQDRFSINLIPHTLDSTTLQHLRPGHKVNLEIDLIARYCERLLHYQNDA